MYRTTQFSETDLTVLNFIIAFHGKELININEKYMMEMFILAILLPIIIYMKQKNYWSNVLLYILSLNNGSFLKQYFNSIESLSPELIHYSLNLTVATFTILTLFSKFIPENMSLENSSLILFSQNLTFVSTLFSLLKNNDNYNYLIAITQYITLVVTICLTLFNIVKIKQMKDFNKCIFYSLELFINFQNIFLLTIINSILLKKDIHLDL